MAARRPKTPLVTRKHVARLERERRYIRLLTGLALGIIALVAVLVGYGILEQTYLQYNQPVAVVNGEAITTRQFQGRVRLQRLILQNNIQQYQQLGQLFGIDVSSQIQPWQNLLNSPETLGQQVLDQLIEDVLIRQEAQRRGITVSAEEIEEEIRRQFNFFPNGTPTPTPTPTPFFTPTLSPETLALITLTPTPTLAPTATPTLSVTSSPEVTPSPDATATSESGSAVSTPVPTTEIPTTPTVAGQGGELTATAEASPTPEPPTPTPTPYTLEAYQADYKTTLERFQAMGIREEDYRAFIEAGLYREKLILALTAELKPEEEQVWARHILVADEATAQTVRERLLKGEDFGKVAAEVSTDPGTKDQGGILDWFGRGVMVQEFEDAAFSLPIGEISQPIKTTYGYHIIQVLARQVRPLSDQELQTKRQQFFDEWLQNQRDQAQLTIYNRWKERVPTTP
ncbi:MAG: peptidylprolyl isomerase [Anaerolineales bacterium]